MRALRAWLAYLDDVQPAVFRRMSRWGTPCRSRLTAQSVALIVKRHAEAVGQDPAVTVVSLSGVTTTEHSRTGSTAV